MSNVKVLNLDQFEGDVKRSVTIKGTSYDVVEMSTQNFIDTMRDAERLSKKVDISPMDELESVITLIRRSIPTCPEEVLRAEPMVKLGIIVKFLRGEMDDRIAQAVQQEEDAGGEAVKKP